MQGMYGNRLLICAVLLVLGSANIAAAATPESTQAPVQQAPAQKGSADGAATIPPDYVIGPGDSLQIFVWRNPELTATVPVRPDGKISTPLVEDMVAVGKNPSGLARDIEQVLGEFVRSPQVNVIVTNPASVFSQVRVLGQVARPQALAFREGMTVLDAVLAVGGLAEFAAGNRAKIVRAADGRQTEIPIRLSSLVNKGEMKYNVTLKPGDVLLVPQSRF